MTRLGKAFSLVLIVLPLSSCSRVQLAYHQLDWVLPYYLESYMDLSEQQEIYVQQQVDKMLAWHCNSQLERYAKLLRDANAQFQNDRMGRAELSGYADHIELFWTDILRHIEPTISQVLLTSTDKQLDELFAGFEVRNNEWYVEYRKTTDEDLRHAYNKRLRKELERWFGPLQKEQIEAIEVWSRSFQSLGEIGMRERQRWQATLRESRTLRDNESRFHESVRKAFSNRQSERSDAYQARLDYNRDLTINAIYKVAQRLSNKQKRHLDKRATSITDDFVELSCEPSLASNIPVTADLLVGYSKHLTLIHQEDIRLHSLVRTHRYR